jgi:hypothetical protein
MPRPRSPERIAADIDKGIRKERRDRKRQEREERRKLRIEKQRVREHVAKNGVPKVEINTSSFGFWDAVHHDHLTFCEGCDRVVYESRMMGDTCEQCFYSKEVIQHEGLKSETQGDTPAPDQLTATARGLEGSAPAQLRLDL